MSRQQRRAGYHRSQIRPAIIILGYALLGWAYCGALIALGRQLMSMDATLLLHAIGAPVGFGLLSWHFHRRFGFTRPLVTATLFLVIVILLDVFLVAMIFEKSFAMFRSFIGTWLPFMLIFAVTYATGTMVTRQGKP